MTPNKIDRTKLKPFNFLMDDNGGLGIAYIPEALPGQDSIVRFSRMVFCIAKEEDVSKFVGASSFRFIIRDATGVWANPDSLKLGWWQDHDFAKLQSALAANGLSMDIIRNGYNQQRSEQAVIDDVLSSSVGGYVPLGTNTDILPNIDAVMEALSGGAPFRTENSIKAAPYADACKLGL